MSCAVLRPARVSQVCVEGPKEKLDTTAISQVGRGGPARKGGRRLTGSFGRMQTAHGADKVCARVGCFPTCQDALIASCCVAAAVGPCVVCVAPPLLALSNHSRPSMLPALLLLRSCVPLRVPTCWTLWMSPAASAWESTQHSHLQVRGAGLLGGFGECGVVPEQGFSLGRGCVARFVVSSLRSSLDRLEGGPSDSCVAVLPTTMW